MAPLQRVSLKCAPCDTGVCTGPSGVQYMDNDGHMNSLGGRPDERHGYQGSWTHGVTIFRGGVPHDVRPPKDSMNRGTVLFVSSTLKPNLAGLPMIKPGTLDERQGNSALFPKRIVRPVSDRVELSELHHGIVLANHPNLKPDMSYEGQTNIVGGRPTERLGSQGGFKRGVRVFRGGEPRFISPAVATNPGTVLYTSSTLKSDPSHELMIKQGTMEERQGRCGSFEHGDLRIHMPTLKEAELWKEPGQKGGRRYASGHFLAGTSTFSGIVPSYRD